MLEALQHNYSDNPSLISAKPPRLCSEGAGTRVKGPRPPASVRRRCGLPQELAFVWDPGEHARADEP